MAKSPDKVTDRIPEWKLQAAGVSELDAMGQQYAASMEGVRLNPYQAKIAAATGMKAGEPDVRLYFDNGRLVFAELKGAGGRLNDDQKKRIPMLRGLGFIVHVVFAVSEDEMRTKLRAIVERERQWPGGSASMESASWFPKVQVAA
jgi:hypothetical protein